MRASVFDMLRWQWLLDLHGEMLRKQTHESGAKGNSLSQNTGVIFSFFLLFIISNQSLNMVNFASKNLSHLTFFHIHCHLDTAQALPTWGSLQPHLTQYLCPSSLPSFLTIATRLVLKFWCLFIHLPQKPPECLSFLSSSAQTPRYRWNCWRQS